MNMNNINTIIDTKKENGLLIGTKIMKKLLICTKRIEKDLCLFQRK